MGQENKKDRGSMIMNVCISVDDHYINSALVMINSLFINNRNIKIHLYVLYTKHQLAKQGREDILKVVKMFHMKADFVSVNDECFRDAPLVEYISITTYYRLLLMDLLPVDKVLYLDTDLVVTGSLEELYNIDMKDKAFAGVLVQSKERKKALGIQSGYPYINAGVLMMNLQWLRGHTTREDMLAYITKNKACLRLADQDVINGMFYRNNKVIPSKYNYCPYKNKRYFEIKKDLYRRPVIYHYRGEKKPWQFKYGGYAKIIFWKYVNRDIMEYPDIFKLIHVIIGEFLELWGFLKQKIIMVMRGDFYHV